MSKFIPYGRQIISEADIDAVTSVLRSDYLTQGPVLDQFEQAVADYCLVNHAVAVANATSALHLACLALDIGPGDLVWTVPNTFVASANCALYCGADIDFVDIDPDTGNLSVEALATKLATAPKIPSALIPVHFAGASCDMQAIHELAQRYHFKVIEDASHAIGGKYAEHPVGGCQFSDICIFSFHPVKIITTGEGGVLTTTNPDIARKLRLLRAHGISKDSNDFTQAAEGPWHYEQHVLGFNYRLTDIQAALGLSQLQQLDHFIAKRHSLVSSYKNRLKNNKDIEWLRTDKNTYSSHHLFVIKVPPAFRARIFQTLRAANIGVNVHYIPVHTQPYFRNLGFNQRDFPYAEQYYSQAITLPLHPALSEHDLDYICDILHQAIAKCKTTGAQ